MQNVYGIIYKEIDSKGKIYIGQTTKSLKARTSQHISSGKKDFIWTIIDQASSKKELDDKEKYWIIKLDTTNPNKGYNIKEGIKYSQKHKDKKMLESYSNINDFNIIGFNCDSTYYKIEQNKIQKLKKSQLCILNLFIKILINGDSKYKKYIIDKNGIAVNIEFILNECSYLNRIKNIENKFIDLIYNHNLFSVFYNDNKYYVYFLPNIVNKYDGDNNPTESLFNNQVEKTASELFNF
jgi:hypothetical protein